MEVEALKQDIASLNQSLSGDIPVRLMFKQKSQLGCLLLRAKEFFLDADYWIMVHECGISPQDAKDLIADMFHRHSYRWN